MKLLVDLSYTQGEGDVVTGIHLYGKSLVDYFLQNSTMEISITLLYGHAIDDKYLNRNDLKIVYLKSKKNSKAYWRELSKVADCYDKVFFPYQIINGKVKCKKAQMYMTVLDLTPLKEVRVNKINKFEKLYKSGFKQKLKYIVKCILRVSGLWYIKRKSALQYNIKHSQKILTISEYSKNDIVNTFKINEEKIYNTYCFANSVNDNSHTSRDWSYKDYYLIISAGRYLKNAHMALFALDKLWSDKVEERNAIVLGNLPSNIIKKIKNKEKIISLGYVNSADLEYFYKNAYCFIFPSLSEGYGLPPAEAMKYGTRVICSDAMSLKELYGETVLFNPYSINSVIEAILKVETIDKDRMVKIYNKIKSSQDKVAEKTLNYLSL